MNSKSNNANQNTEEAVGVTPDEYDARSDEHKEGSEKFNKFCKGCDGVVHVGVVAGVVWHLGRSVNHTYENAKLRNSQNGHSNSLRYCTLSHLVHTKGAKDALGLQMQSSSASRIADQFSTGSTSSESFLLTDSGSDSDGSDSTLSSSDSSEGAGTHCCTTNSRTEVHNLEQWANATAHLCRQEACHQLTEQGISASTAGWHSVARALWRQAAAAGHAPAMFNLGLTFARRQQEKHAEFWYRRASKAGHGAAAYNLALLLNGKMGARMENEVRQLLEKAATAGVVAAQQLLNSEVSSVASGRYGY